MTTDSVLRALLGGALVGVAAAIALVVHGRIAGISGTLQRALDRDDGGTFRVPFLLGLIATGLVIVVAMPAAIGQPVTRLPGLLVAGVLVGAGTTLANGCTSGHGVCGVARLSPRSLVAVATFIGTGMLTVALARLA